MDLAPSAGTDFHKSQEEFTNNLLPRSHEHYDLCATVESVITKETHVDDSIWTTEKSFVHEGYGGQADLYLYNDNVEWIIDYKTKQTADKFKPGKMVYSNHSEQLAAYRAAIAPKARCVNVFVCLESGEVDFHEHTEEQLE
ncbi:MAG TPA: hypothetical protein EYQ26_15480, partial [Rhodospirillales bacterium]|nr:hypothetical protein [Rhodospirillales bacterium]